MLAESNGINDPSQSHPCWKRKGNKGWRLSIFYVLTLIDSICLYSRVTDGFPIQYASTTFIRDSYPINFRASPLGLGWKWRIALFLREENYFSFLRFFRHAKTTWCMTAAPHKESICIINAMKTDICALRARNTSLRDVHLVRIISR